MGAPLDPAIVAEAREAPRMRAAIGLGGWADAGAGIGRGGPSLALSVPVYFGARRKVFQWALAIDAVGTWDHGAALAMIAGGPTVLARIHLGRVYAIHAGIGPHLSGQLGAVRSLGIQPMTFTIENAFRFFDDDRKRLVLGFRLGPGLWFRNSDTDAPFGGAAMVYAGYETSL